MRAKTFPIVVALLTLTISACSSEPEKTPPTEKNTSATETSLAAEKIQQPQNLTSKTTPVGCTTILDSHCTACHHATRICQKLGRKNTKGWKRTISNMIKHGAQLSSTETETLIRCLDQQKEEVTDYCK